MTTLQPDRLSPSTRVLWLTVLAVAFLYMWGIDNLYMPSNGDEMVYAHIARLTAESGRWLPLVSELNDMRNTKPPLLFWQSMVVSGGGAYWQLWWLRLPSLVYLGMVCAGMSLLLRRWLGEWRTAAWAVLCVLLCWGTFRYGRPYLKVPLKCFGTASPLVGCCGERPNLISVGFTTIPRNGLLGLCWVYSPVWGWPTNRLL